MLKKTAVLLFVAALSLSGNAFAIELQEAKDRGLVGESNSGYLDYVKKPPGDDVKALVHTINERRKKKFIDTARANDLTEDQVAERFYQRGVKATQSGHYYRDSQGRWVAK